MLSDILFPEEEPEEEDVDLAWARECLGPEEYSRRKEEAFAFYHEEDLTLEETDHMTIDRARQKVSDYFG